MDAADCSDPYGRPARRTQWIVSTLAYHYGLDRGVENEIIVLATGLDQYLQEIFHHLDYRGAGRIPVGDFSALCEVLGLKQDQECPGVLEGLPGEISFRLFHARLCGYFSSKAGCGYENGRLLVGEDSEHIETQIRLRTPLKRREKLLSVGTSGRSSPCAEERHAPGCRLGSCSRECYEEIVALEEAEDRIGKLEDENASLRELIEDMRAALQSSDARCLALQVGLWKSRLKQKPEEGGFVSEQRAVGLQNIVQEVGLLHHSRGWLLEDALRCSQRLEQELWSSRETVVALQREQLSMRKKVEEARQALRISLGKVKDLEVKARDVPALQRYILQLKSEMLCQRSEASKLQLSGSSGSELSANGGTSWRCCSDTRHDRCPPPGCAVTTPDKMEEQLFRSVEGQAASDEEEERWSDHQQRQVDEVKRILTRLSSCSEGCENRIFRKWMSQLESSRSDQGCSAVLELLRRRLELKEAQPEVSMDQMTKRCLKVSTTSKMKESQVQELQQKAEETGLLQAELHMLETGKVRLSLLEEKLGDILQFLHELRDLDVSRRSLGKILVSTLESGSDPQHSKAHILEVLNALCHELASCELLPPGGAHESTSNQQTLIISC
uniref:EF-hand and coiled-coil domain containing 1 n=1 Tax=Oryzias sinensis TaxID=183150 RepID=A0A8C7YYB5_9TELE